MEHKLVLEVGRKVFIFVIRVSSFEVSTEIKLNEMLTNLLLKSYYISKAAEREALEKAQERELRRQKEELMNGKVRLVVSLLLFPWLDFVLVWLALYNEMNCDNKNHFPVLTSLSLQRHEIRH